MQVNKRKILAISGVAERIGGSNAALVENIVHMRNRYDFLVVLPSSGTFGDQLDELGIDWIVINSKRWRSNGTTGIVRKLMKVVYNQVAEVKLKKVIKQEKIDIVHINVSAIDVGVSAAKWTRTPLIWHLREKNDDMPLDLKLWAQRRFMQADKLLAASEYIKGHFQDYIGKDVAIEVLPDGVDFSTIKTFEPRHTGSADHTFVFGFGGGLAEHKRIDVVLAAMSKLTEKVDFKLIVAGTGDAAEFKTMLDNYGIDESRVEFMGYLNNLNELFEKVDIMISASIEAFGRVAVEARAAGKIIVGADAGATKDILTKGHISPIFTYGDGQSLANKLIEIIENFDEEQRVVSAETQLYRDRYGVEEVVKKLSVAYEDVLNEE